MRLLFDNSTVRDYVETQGYKLLSPFIDSRIKIKLKCPNGHTYETHFDNFKNKGSRCRECKGLKKYTIESIRYFIEIESNSGYKLVSAGSVKNNKSKIKMLCDMGHQFEASFSSFKNNGTRCPLCSNQRRALTKTHTFDYVKNYIENESGFNFTLLDTEYTSSITKMRMKCSNGHVFEKSFNSVLVEKGCSECHFQSVRGENSPHWNPNLTEDDRKGYRKNTEGYKEWILSVYERDNYICQSCGSSESNKINAHHMDGYNWCVIRRIDISNGVTLCDTCHTKFHKEYGYGDNTEEQFITWINQNGIVIFNTIEIA